MSIENEENSTEEVDRRRCRRYPITLRILFQRSGLTHFLEADADNISEGGLCIKTKRRPPEAGTELSLLIPLADGELMISGVVRWTSETRFTDKNAPPSMGVEFVGMDDSTRERLRSLIAEIQTAGP